MNSSTRKAKLLHKHNKMEQSKRLKHSSLIVIKSDLFMWVLLFCWHLLNMKKSFLDETHVMWMLWAMKSMHILEEKDLYSVLVIEVLKYECEGLP